LLDLEDRPGDPYILFHLGKEAEKRNEYASACQFFEQSLAFSPEKANWLHPLVIRYVTCLKKAGELDKALLYISEHVGRWNHSPDFFFEAGNVAFEKAKSDRANALANWIPLALSAWETCLEIGDRPELEESYHGVGSHLAQSNLDAVRSVLNAGGRLNAA
jgi:tetratricopeptide (TPR) repeat protein